jgi:hypothetical protein
VWQPKIFISKPLLILESHTSTLSKGFTHLKKLNIMRTIFNYPFLIKLDENGNLMLNSGLTSRYLFNYELEDLQDIVDRTLKYYQNEI